VRLAPFRRPIARTGSRALSTPNEIDAYCRYMEEERGLSPTTIGTARQHLTKFFEKAPKHRLIKYTITDVEQFLATLGQQGWTRNGIRSFAYRLRGFFKYGESQG
jgi:site-specific recombinase XerD